MESWDPLLQQREWGDTGRRNDVEKIPQLLKSRQGCLHILCVTPGHLERFGLGNPAARPGSWKEQGCKTVCLSLPSIWGMRELGEAAKYKASLEQSSEVNCCFFRLCVSLRVLDARM